MMTLILKFANLARPQNLGSLATFGRHIRLWGFVKILSLVSSVDVLHEALLH